MKTTRSGSSDAREPMVKRTRTRLQYQRKYLKNKRERLDCYCRGYYAKNKERITQKQRKIAQSIVRLGVWDQESEKLETSPVLSEHAVTICEILTEFLSCSVVVSEKNTP